MGEREGEGEGRERRALGIRPQWALNSGVHCAETPLATEIVVGGAKSTDRIISIAVRSIDMIITTTIITTIIDMNAIAMNAIAMIILDMSVIAMVIIDMNVIAMITTPVITPP